MRKFRWKKSKKKPMLVELTEESSSRINTSKKITVVPGDIAVPESPIIGSAIDSTGFTGMNFLIVAENLSVIEARIRCRGFVGPVGGLTEFELINNGWIVKPGEGKTHWMVSYPIFTNAFRAEFHVEEAPNGTQIDINSELLLTKSTAASS